MCIFILVKEYVGDMVEIIIKMASVRILVGGEFVFGLFSILKR